MLATTDISRADGGGSAEAAVARKRRFICTITGTNDRSEFPICPNASFLGADGATRSSETIAMRLPIVTYGYNVPNERAVREVREFPCLSWSRRSVRTHC
jgi:hypothetical protein